MEKYLEPDRLQATIWRVRIQNMLYLLLFHRNNGWTNAPKCDVISSLFLRSERMSIVHCSPPVYVIFFSDRLGTVFWDVTLCNRVGRYRRFGGPVSSIFRVHSYVASHSRRQLPEYHHSRTISNFTELSPAVLSYLSNVAQADTQCPVL